MSLRLIFYGLKTVGLLGKEFEKNIYKYKSLSYEEQMRLEREGLIDNQRTVRRVISDNEQRRWRQEQSKQVDKSAYSDSQKVLLILLALLLVITSTIAFYIYWPIIN